jgi:hypothetical protein
MGNAGGIAAGKTAAVLPPMVQERVADQENKRECLGISDA